MQLAKNSILQQGDPPLCPRPD